MNLLIINGPNLNMLGIREPSIYGTKTYNDLVELLQNYSNKKNIEVEIIQSNHEGIIIDKIHEAYFNNVDGIIINPGAYTHYSYAILDAIKSVNIPTIEVHLSDISKRDEFRKHSVISEACISTIKGEHFNGYLKAIDYFIDNNK